MEDYQDIQNDECMSMTEKDISAVIKSCRDKLGKSVKKKVVQAETKGFGK